jgi:hypothetical protein
MRALNLFSDKSNHDKIYNDNGLNTEGVYGYRRKIQIYRKRILNKKCHNSQRQGLVLNFLKKSMEGASISKKKVDVRKVLVRSPPSTGQKPRVHSALDGRYTTNSP